MKKMILTLVALLSMTVAQAQDNNKSDKCECKKEMRHGKERKQMTPEEMTDRMAKDLSLTDAQKSKVLALNKEYQDVLGKRPHMKRPQKPQVDGESGATEQQDRPMLPSSRRFSTTINTRSTRRCRSIIAVTVVLVVTDVPTVRVL